MAEVIKTVTEDYYVCDRCERTSADGAYGKARTDFCPCPRGNCEARIAGSITATFTLDKTVTEEQKKWNEENNR
jgi:hypothetical protein